MSGATRGSANSNLLPPPHPHPSPLAPCAATSQPTQMTLRSSSTRILGLTATVKAPPLCRPSAPTCSPYSSSLCCSSRAGQAATADARYAMEGSGRAAGQTVCGNRRPTWPHTQSPAAPGPHQVADDPQRDGGQASVLVPRCHVAVRHAALVGSPPVRLGLLRRGVVHGLPLCGHAGVQGDDGGMVRRWCAACQRGVHTPAALQAPGALPDSCPPSACMTGTYFSSSL